MGLAGNTWLVEVLGGRPVAFAMLFWGRSCQGESSVFVHAEHRDRGLEEALFEALEARARELSGEGSAGSPCSESPRLHITCLDSRSTSRGWLEDHGYVIVRESFEMGIELGAESVPSSSLPEGLRLSTFDPTHDEASVFSAQEEAFADGFLFEPSTLEEWRRHRTEPFDFDPALWLIAWDGGEVAGESLTVVTPEQAYVASLTVRGPWRGKGLGLALLTRAFELAREKGHSRVWLGVDAQNATGALALYLKAGMHVERRYVVYVRDLR